MTTRSLEFDFDQREEPAKKRADEGPRTLTVAELGRSIRGALDRNFRIGVFVEGEVANARAASSGHVYFTLKDSDEDAQIDVAMYKGSLTARMRACIEDGKLVRLRGKAQFWAPRGRLQFIAERVELAGKGALLLALEELKAKLLAEGLFAPEKKRRLPESPRVIGVVTSAEGAVIHDIAKVAFRRGGARILLAPALVQGAGAAASVIRAIAALERIPGVDVIIVGRGGGSADDLMTWNDEALVRRVAACKIPVVSAVGHEVDVTLVDFAADARAATPSQAAEMVVADANVEQRFLREQTARLVRVMKAVVIEKKHELVRVVHGLPDPDEYIAEQRQWLDATFTEIEDATRARVHAERVHHERLEKRLDRMHPRAVLSRERALATAMHARLCARSEKRVARERSDLGALFGRLDAMSPLKVLARGYAIATKEDGRAVRASHELTQGERVRVRVSRGSFTAQVERVEHVESSNGDEASNARDPEHEQ